MFECHVPCPTAIPHISWASTPAQFASLQSLAIPLQFMPPWLPMWWSITIVVASAFIAWMWATSLHSPFIHILWLAAANLMSGPLKQKPSLPSTTNRPSFGLGLLLVCISIFPGLSHHSNNLPSFVQKEREQSRRLFPIPASASDPKNPSFGP
jgi:hypothetical protein